MQKSALLGSAYILRKVLEVWGLGMRLDWIFLPRENPCAKFYVIITSLISTKRLYSLIYNVQYLKLSFPKIPLNFTLNTSKLVINWDSSGRLIHSFWPLKVNARWPAAVLQSGICRRSLFLVLQLCTSDLVLNFWQRYGGASPFKHLNTMVASLTALAVTWSNFLLPETIWAAKLCTVCNSLMFFSVLLTHTDEQYNNLLNTRELIIVINVRLSY